jgi:hypothetical protein
MKLLLLGRQAKTVNGNKIGTKCFEAEKKNRRKVNWYFIDFVCARDQSVTKCVLRKIVELFFHLKTWRNEKSFVLNESCLSCKKVFKSK